MSEQGPALTVEGLNVGYGSLKVLKDVGIAATAGQVVAIIGANGAGKSTLLKTISGLLEPSSGTIRLAGRDITRVPAHERVRMGIAQVPEGREIFGELRVDENLTLGSFVRRHDKAGTRRNLDRVLTLFPILGERMHQLAGTLSGGQQQMLAIGRALMSEPRVLMLDEPSLGLAPLVVRSIFKVILELRDAGLAVVLVEQKARAALGMADYAYTLETGRIAMEGTGRALLEDEQLQRLYLGRDFLPDGRPGRPVESTQA